MNQLPTGTVTFLFTDVEGSTVLVQRLGEQYRSIHEAHAELLRAAVTGGIEVSTEGDAFFFVFPSVQDAVSSAVAIQHSLAGHAWPAEGSIKVRIGVHTGQGTLGGDNYIGLDVHRAARIASSAHGGQVVLSATTEALARSQLPPSTELRDLGEFALKDLSQPERLFQLVIADLPNDFPPLRAVGSGHNNLPMPVTSFIGRKELLEEAVHLLQGTRLLTLTGPGGTGKTRLGLRLSAEVASRHPDGVYFVDLSPVVDPALVASTIVSAVGLPVTTADATARLASHFKERRSLLFLDNFEQVLEAASTISELLRSAPQVSVLVTSRAPLKIAGEQEMPVPTFPLPQDGARDENEAVQLFAERARLVRPDFRIDDGNVDSVVGIVNRLDGLPLAIELAAARVKVLSPSAILERLSDRLGLLTGGARDLPDRQRTLRSAIAWSYDLLNPVQKAVFDRMSVFVGPAHLDQIETVCDLNGDVLETVEALLDHSLIRTEEYEGGSRFRMLETIKEFAADNLTGAVRAEVRGRHAQLFKDLAAASVAHIYSLERGVWLDRIESQQENYRAALNHLIDLGDGDAACQMADSLWRFWQMRGHLAEGTAAVEQVLALPGTGAAATAVAHRAAGGLAWWRGDMADCESHYRLALELHRAIGDQAAIADDLYNLALPIGRYDIEEADRLLDEGFDIYRGLDDQHGVANILWGRATLFTISEELESALDVIGQALDRFLQTEDVFMIGWSYRMQGFAALRLGLLDQAKDSFHAGLSTFAQAGDVLGIEFFLRDFAELALVEGDYERAFRLVGVVTALRQETGSDLIGNFTNEIRGLEEAQALVGRTRADELVIEGRMMSIAEVVHYATNPG